MATTVTYNGITLHNVVTRRFDQEITYDQSGTDLIGHKFSLSFEGILHAQRVPLSLSTAYIAPIGISSANSAAAVYDTVKRLLGQPRGLLIVQFGGQTVLSAGPTAISGETAVGRGGLDPDVDNGPKPRRVAISHVSGNSVYRVSFDIDCTLSLCSPGRSNMVLSNRWQIVESMDANFFVERRIQGRMRLSSSHGVGGHAFKHVIVPGLEIGFARKRVEFAVEENGLDCTYTIVDNQVHTSAPWPATKMSARHTEATSDGVKFISDVYVRLDGPPHVDKRLLIERAVQIADNRLNFIEQTTSTGEDEPQMLIEFAQITDHIGEEATVELNIRVQQLRTAGEFLTHVRKEVLGTPLALEQLKDDAGDINGTEYDPRLSPYPALYGYDPHGGERRPAVLLLLQCYLQNPCINIHSPSQGQQEADNENTPEREREGTQVEERPPGSIEEEQLDRYSDSARAALYTMSKITTQYVTQDMKVAMPISRIVPARNIQAPTNVIFDLCEPQAYKKIDIDVERAGQLPELPEPHAVITDGTLVATRKSKDERLYPPVLSADGRHQIFRIEATYWYILNRPPLDGEQLRIGRHPNTQGLVSFVSPNQLYESSLV